DVLASISTNRSAVTTTQLTGGGGATSHPEMTTTTTSNIGEYPRAMTPLYTQEDATGPSGWNSSSSHRNGGEFSTFRHREATGSNTYRHRRSSSPPSPGDHHSRLLHQRSLRSPSPLKQHDQHHHHHHRQSAAGSSPAQVLSLGPTSELIEDAGVMVSDDMGEAMMTERHSENGDEMMAMDDSSGVLPLPSPLLSPRAHPESMDTDEESDGERLQADMDMSPPETATEGRFLQHEFEMGPGTSSTKESRVVTRERMSQEMAALYSMPSILTTYDQLPANMQSFLLYQLLRRTPRPILQFATQTMLPVLQRDFVSELPVEVSHHILKFMDTRSLCRASCVSRRWQDVVNGDAKVWRARLSDARYVPDHERTHPLGHAYFGLGNGPARLVTAPRPTRQELDTGCFPQRKCNVEELTAHVMEQAGESRRTGPVPTNAFKEEFARDYVLDRNWHEGKCRHISFVSEGGSVVTCVQLTDDYIIAGFDTKNIYVYDITTGATVRQLVGHEGGVWALAVVGNTVISGSTDRTVRIWDLETGRCTHVFAGHSSTVRCLQVLLPTDTRTPLERARNEPVRYEPSEPLIVTGSRDTTLRVWKLPSPTKDTPYVPRTGVAAKPAAATGGSTTTAAASMEAGAAMAVDVGPDAPPPGATSPAAILAQARTQATGRVAAAVAATVAAAAANTTNTAAANTSNAGAATTAAAAAASVRTPTGSLRVSGPMAPSVFGRHMQAVARNADGTSRPFSLPQAATTGDTPARRIAALPQAEMPPPPRTNPYFMRVLEGHTDSVRAVAGFGNLVVSGSYDFAIRVWNVVTGQCLHVLEGHTAKVYTLALDTNLHLVISGSLDGTIRVWDWDTGACVRILRGHLTLVGLLALDHNTLVSAGADATLRVWDHPMQQPMPTCPTQRPFSNIDGDVLLGGPRETVRPSATAVRAVSAAQQQQQLQQLHLLQHLQIQQRANDQVHQQQIANMAGEDLVRTERFVLRHHTNAITCFQHDGTKIVSGADGTVKLWDVRTGAFVRDLLSGLSGVWQVRFDRRRCVAAVHRNDVSFFEVMDFGAEPEC
ncbi:SCF ubiquitin ligase complex subunit cdc4, partial [Linderina pennispora]